MTAGFTENSLNSHQLAVSRDVLRAAASEDAGATAELARKVAEEVAAHDFVILSLKDAVDDYAGFRAACTGLARALGPLMVQNEAGDTVVEVYDRHVGRIEDGARYHQTRQGGDIHIDSVNRPEAMEYLILGCAAPALIGGESIVIRADDVVARLAGVPNVIETLAGRFWFEGRGMASEPGLFQMPVLTRDSDGARFRYLRTYIESAHQRAGEPLTAEQAFAFDVLDAVLEMSALQTRLTLDQGDLLIAADTRVFHGRTSFIDALCPENWTPGRCMLRFWVALAEHR